jgi:hypothetical protein
VHPVEGHEADWPGEAKIAGRAVIGDAIPEGEAFVADIYEVVFTHLDPGATRLVIESWTPDRGVRVVERE